MCNARDPGSIPGSGRSPGDGNGNHSSIVLLLSCMSCFYILGIKPLSVASFMNIFSQFTGCVFVLFVVSFAVQKLISLLRFHLFVFAFISLALGD